MKKSLLTLAASLALVGCSNEDLLSVDNNQAQEGDAIAFSTYVGDNAQSRASVIEIEDLQVNGFGVNAYYTGQEEFSADATYEGNAIFMDNTKVIYNAEKSAWTYSPIKYWPNNAGDKLSFFAYAPYSSGQIAFDGSNKSTLTFTVAEDVKEQVDLIYHKADGDEELGCEKTTDLEKPSVNSKVSFNFQHALSRITFDVKAVVDETDAEGDNLLDGNTRINVKKVALVGANTDYETEGLAGSFYASGTLNLVDGEWSETSDEQGFEFTGDNFYRAVEDAATAETVVQLTKFNPAQTLLNEDSYLMIIPQDFSEEGDETTEGYRIYIEYDVISEEVENNGSDSNSTNDSNTITNKIYSAPMHTTFVAGQAYRFTLLLGMTSVKFDADVAGWNEETDSEWLPNNRDEEEGGDDEGDDNEGEGEKSVLDDSTVASASLEGEGTEEDPYLIEDAEDLLYLCYSERGENLYDESVGKYYKLVNDIEVTSSDWTSIVCFKGTFDGNNKTISGTLNCSRYGAVFGHFSGTVKNLNVSADIVMNETSGLSEVIIGGICGFVGDGLIEECTFTGTIEEPSMDLTGYSDIYIGGIVGEIRNSGTAEIRNCTSSGTINLPDSEAVQAGGIIGYSLFGKVVGCTFDGTINTQNSSSEYIGSIAGRTNGSGGVICTTCNKNESESNSDLQMIGSDEGSVGTSCENCSNE